MAAMVMTVKKTFLCVEDEERSPRASGCDGVATWPVFRLGSADKLSRRGASDGDDAETAASSAGAEDGFADEEASSVDEDARGSPMAALCAEQTCDPFSLRSGWHGSPAYIPLPPQQPPALPHEMEAELFFEAGRPLAEAPPLPPSLAPRPLRLSLVLDSPSSRAQTAARAPALTTSPVGQEAVEARAEAVAPYAQSEAAPTSRLSERRSPAKAAPRRDEAAVCEGSAEARTTVMMRNLPNDYTRQMLLDLLDSRGFAGHYDFFYLPMDFATGSNIGYAFINFASPSSATIFWQAFDGFSRWSLRSRKVCNLCWSDPTQGLDANVKRYRNSPVMCDDVPEHFKPMLFSSQGKQMKFPAPTRALRPPRIAQA